MAALLRHLPETSAVAEVLGGAEAKWRLEHHLLACLHDAVAVLDWHLVSVNTSSPPPKPRPLQRPGVRPPEDRLGNTAHLDMAQVRAYLDQFKPREE